jgi:hypothetical protein
VITHDIGTLFFSQHSHPIKLLSLFRLQLTEQQITLIFSTNASLIDAISSLNTQQMKQQSGAVKITMEAHGVLLDSNITMIYEIGG